jgi:hypothetical protein
MILGVGAAREARMTMSGQTRPEGRDAARCRPDDRREPDAGMRQ